MNPQEFLLATNNVIRGSGPDPLGASARDGDDVGPLSRSSSSDFVVSRAFESASVPPEIGRPASSSFDRFFLLGQPFVDLGDPVGVFAPAPPTSTRVHLLEDEVSDPRFTPPVDDDPLLVGFRSRNRSYMETEEVQERLRTYSPRILMPSFEQPFLINARPVLESLAFRTKKRLKRRRLRLLEKNRVDMSESEGETSEVFSSEEEEGEVVKSAFPIKPYKARIISRGPRNRARKRLKEIERLRLRRGRKTHDLERGSIAGLRQQGRRKDGKRPWLPPTATATFDGVRVYDDETLLSYCQVKPAPMMTVQEVEQTEDDHSYKRCDALCLTVGSILRKVVRCCFDAINGADPTLVTWLCSLVLLAFVVVFFVVVLVLSYIS